MAKTRKNQFGPALKAAFFCLLITGSAVGYVWQKGEIDQLGRQIGQRDARLRQLRINNQKLAERYAEMHEPIQLEKRAEELNLGLQPVGPDQLVRIVESVEPAAAPRIETRQWAERDNFAPPLKP